MPFYLFMDWTSIKRENLGAEFNFRRILLYILLLYYYIGSILFEIILAENS